MREKYLMLNCFACGFSLGAAISLFAGDFFIGGLVCLVLSCANVPFVVELYNIVNSRVD